MLRVLVADDHPVFRRGLKDIIGENPDMAVLGEATDGREALLEATSGKYDVVLLDITMPGRDGLDVLAELRRLRPALPVLILSMHPEEQYAVRALRIGASGYLTKESAPDELVTAIRKVSAGRKYVSSSLAERLAFLLEESEESPHEKLSYREYQIMCMIATGKTATSIAEELSLSVKTVSTYRSRILVKMRMESTAELIRYAIKNRLVD